jgi:hypothetical protein
MTCRCWQLNDLSDVFRGRGGYIAGFVRYFCDDPANGLPYMARGFELGPRRSASAGVVNYPFLSSRDPYHANLRGDWRFEPLMARVKTIRPRL